MRLNIADFGHFAIWPPSPAATPALRSAQFLTLAAQLYPDRIRYRHRRRASASGVFSILGGGAIFLYKILVALRTIFVVMVPLAARGGDGLMTLDGILRT